MTLLRIDIPGSPIAQGSKTAGATPQGRAYVRDANGKHLKPWRQHATTLIRTAVTRQHWTTTTGPVEVCLVFLHKRPLHHYGTGRNAATLKPNAPRWKATKPDLDKLARAILDSLTTAKAITDDSNVARLIAEDRYTNDPGNTGVIVTVRTIPPEE